MENKHQFEKYEIGSISLFTGLGFLTVIPFVMRSLFIFLDPVIYRFFGGFFLFLTAIFYIISPEYYKKQLRMLGISFILFSVFQFFYTKNIVYIATFSKYISLLLGIILIILEIYLNKKRQPEE